MNYSNEDNNPNLDVFDNLSELEYLERLELEKVVKTSFVQAGRALKILRDKRLYRNTHQSFEDYCFEVFAMGRSHSYRLIDASIVVENLSGKMSPIGDILPTNESQVRPLTKLNDASEQLSVWSEAVKSAGDKVPTAKLVKSIVAEYILSKQINRTNFQVGDICQIILKEHPKLRGRSGQWCIIIEVYEFAYSVQFWDGIFPEPLKPEYFKLMDHYSPSEKQQMLQLAERLSKIPKDRIDYPVHSFLLALGKLQRPYLLPMEEKVLSVIESDLNLE